MTEEKKILELVETARESGKIKKGANEATKAIEKGLAKIVVYAGDVSPKEIIMHLPLLCKEKNVPCFEIKSKEELGAAAGLGVGTAAIAVIREGEAKSVIDALIRENTSVRKEERKEEMKEELAEEKKEKPKKQANSKTH